MPSASKHLRDKFMVNRGDGIVNAESVLHRYIVHNGLIIHGGRLTPEERDAIEFLCDEWDYEDRVVPMAVLSHYWSVRKFHAKFGFSISQRLSDLTECDSGLIQLLAERLRAMDEEFRQASARHMAMTGDDRAFRTTLILGELAELAEALVKLDKEAVADAIGDLDYTVAGAAVSYDIPLDAVFAEIHRSNMTKSASSDLGAKGRMKGPEFSPADIAGVLKEYSK